MEIWKALPLICPSCNKNTPDLGEDLCPECIETREIKEITGIPPQKLVWYHDHTWKTLKGMQLYLKRCTLTLPAKHPEYVHAS